MGRTACRPARFVTAALALAGTVVAIAGPGAGSATARTVDNAQLYCGRLTTGPRWTARTGSGTDWYVAGLTTRDECATAANWTRLLSKRVVARTGPVVSAFTVGSYGCVADRTRLTASCYRGQGGAGAIGVLVAGDPLHNPIIPAATRARIARPPLPPAIRVEEGAGVPWPFEWGTAYNRHTCGESLDATRYSAPAHPWSLALSHGAILRGTDWRVETFRFVSEGTCAAIRNLLPQLVSGGSGPNGEWTWNGWTCLTTVRRAGDIVPLRGCARVVFPHGVRQADGTPSLAPALEQVIVYPDIRAETRPRARYGVVDPADGGTLLTPTAAQGAEFVEQLQTLPATIRDYGISLLQANWMRMLDLNDRDSGATRGPAWTWPIRLGCGGLLDQPWRGQAVPSAEWRHGTAHGTGWALVTTGGYSCALGDGLFRTFLANLLASSETPTLVSQSPASSGAANPLSRYGWRCTVDRDQLLAVCRQSVFSRDRWQTALGWPQVPFTFAIAVEAANVPGLSADRAKIALETS